MALMAMPAAQLDAALDALLVYLIVAPLLIGNITNHHNTVHTWSAVVYTIMCHWLCVRRLILHRHQHGVAGECGNH